jgi:protocatechuate 3,4-dioxygenase alpha subunit
MGREFTPSQTVGPFFSIGLPWEAGPGVVDEGAAGALIIRGVVLDGDGDPVPDAIVETWQPDAEGSFETRPDFRGFARAATEDGTGQWWIRTIRPAAVPGPDGSTQAPHLAVSVFARGLLHRVVTRMYFPEDGDLQAVDPVLAAVPAQRRGTLIAERTDDGYRFDIRLQGDDETVFFAI